MTDFGRKKPEYMAYFAKEPWHIQYKLVSDDFLACSTATVSTSAKVVVVWLSIHLA